MLDSIGLMFQMFIDVYSGYIRRVPDDINAVTILMELRQERQDYLKDNTLDGKTIFTELVNQTDEIIQNVKEEINDLSNLRS